MIFYDSQIVSHFDREIDKENDKVRERRGGRYVGTRLVLEMKEAVFIFGHM